MAKGNLFLGFGRGKLGSVVMYRANGEQVTRARNRSPKNPQTALQLLQRVVMHTASTAYSQMSKICDHSFQGLQPGTPNQSRFLQLNVAMLRSRCAEEINSGDPNVIASSRKYNFMSKGDFAAVVNPYIVSEGSLPSMNAYFDASNQRLKPLSMSFSNLQPNYADVIAYLGAQRGDQLTFIEMCADTQSSSHDPFVTGFRFARVILEPSDGDLTHTFGYTSGDRTYYNTADEGYIRITVVPVVPGSGEDPINTLTYSLVPANQDYTRYQSVATAVILSRRQGNSWLRSSESLSLIDLETITNQLDGGYLGDAIMSYLSETNSSLYLNQAEKI